MYLKIGLIASLVIVASDLAAKWFVAALVMNPPRVIEVVPFFNLVLVHNRGISFGLFNSANPATPILISSFAIIIVVILTAWLRRSRNIVEAAGIGAIIGGASANVIDRVADGSVTDFLDFYIGAVHWPAFNFADAAIFCGAAMIVLRPRTE